MVSTGGRTNEIKTHPCRKTCRSRARLPKDYAIDKSSSPVSSLMKRHSEIVWPKIPSSMKNSRYRSLCRPKFFIWRTAPHIFATLSMVKRNVLCMPLPSLMIHLKMELDLNKGLTFLPLLLIILLFKWLEIVAPMQGCRRD